MKRAIIYRGRTIIPEEVVKRADKSFRWYAYYEFNHGCVRRYDGGVVRGRLLDAGPDPLHLRERPWRSSTASSSARRCRASLRAALGVRHRYKDGTDEVLWRDLVTLNGNVIGDQISLGSSGRPLSSTWATA